MELPDIENLKLLSVPFEDLEIIRTVADFKDERLKNSIIYYYKMYEGNTHIGNAYYMRHYLGSGHLNFNCLAFLSPRNRVRDFKVLSTIALGVQYLDVYNFVEEDIIGMDPGDVKFRWKDLEGLEEYFRILRDDIRALGEINKRAIADQIP